MLSSSSSKRRWMLQEPSERRELLTRRHMPEYLESAKYCHLRCITVCINTNLPTFRKNTLPPSSGQKMELVSFYCALLNFCQNARRCILQDFLHSLNSSENTSVNSCEIYLHVLPALYALNVKNWCTFLISGEAKHLLVITTSSVFCETCDFITLFTTACYWSLSRDR